jgi:cation:H+ antiporter
VSTGGEILIALLVILAAAEIFTNALEHAGERLNISEGVTGSLFAAVATAMPETMVPILALFAGTANAELNADIGVGAILGAPLMLSTLSLFLMGCSVVRQRGWAGRLHPEPNGLRRDLSYFLAAFALAALALFVPRSVPFVHASLALALVVLYFFYVMVTMRASSQLVNDGHGTEAHAELFLCRLGLPDRWPVIVAQLLGGFALLVAGAKGFIHAIEQLSAVIGISALVLSLLIIPIATELPEKVNSILWIRRRKDTLAFGNITGAMVFQGTLLPAIGITLTPWSPQPAVLAGIAVTFIAAFWLRSVVALGGLAIKHLAVNGLLYGAYLGYALA